ncbi:VanZ family protein, partial [Ralstonia pseudosolanacearum]
MGIPSAFPQLPPVTDLHALPAAPSTHRHSPLARAGLAWFVLLVVYASLYPFSGWIDTGVSPFAYLSAPLPRYNTRFDLLTNIWGYLPLGMLVVLSLHPRVTGWRAVALAMLAGLLLSGAMEAAQTYLPTRISSNVDLAANTVGALLGGIVMVPFAARLIDRGSLRRLRWRWFEPHATFAIPLLLLWPFAQIFPQEFLFSMGGVVRSILLDPSPDAFLTGIIHSLFPGLFDWHDRLQAHPEGLQRQELLEALITACSWV